MEVLAGELDVMEVLEGILEVRGERGGGGPRRERDCPSWVFHWVFVLFGVLTLKAS